VPSKWLRGCDSGYIMCGPGEAVGSHLPGTPATPANGPALVELLPPTGIAADPTTGAPGFPPPAAATVAVAVAVAEAGVRPEGSNAGRQLPGGAGALDGSCAVEPFDAAGSDGTPGGGSGGAT
jgi:hypothetical protein